MAASILNSPKAVEMSVFLVRAFVQLRTLLSTHKEITTRLDELEHKISDHDGTIADIIKAIQQLMALPEKPKPSIGFMAELPKKNHLIPLFRQIMTITEILPVRA